MNTTAGDVLAFVQTQQTRCHADRRVGVRVVGFASIAACLVALGARTCVRSSKRFKFPDNTFIIGLCLFVVAHGSMLTGVVDDSAFLRQETRAERATCQTQAVLTHWSLIALMLNAIYVVLVLYALVVRRVALAKIVAKNRLYYIVVFGGPTVAVVACLTFGQGYMPTDDELCWIRSSLDRFVWHLSFMALGAVVCILATPPLLYTLFKAYRGVDEPSRGRVFRTMLIRLLLVSLYVALLFAISLLTSMNESILASASADSTAAHYVMATLYSYCMIRSYVVASMGLTVATILSVKKRHMRKLLAMVHLAAQENGPQSVDSDQRRRRTRSRLLGHSSLRSPRSPRVRQLCPSAADAAGCTAVSIPPDPQHHRAHLIASQAYTSYVLEHARDMLLVPQNSFSSDYSSSESHATLDSLLSGSSFSSHTSYVSVITPRRRRSGEQPLDGDHQQPQHVTEL